MKKILTLIIAVLMVQLALAGTITYDVTVSGTANEQNFSSTVSETKECEFSCDFTMPQFELPGDFTLKENSISNVTGQPNKISFSSTGTLASAQANDTIKIEYALPKKELKITKMVTSTLNQGQNNIVVQLENTGNVDLANVSIQASGDGVKTTDRTLVNIGKGKTEFATAIVSITNAGTIDVIIKAYAQDSMLAQTIETININAAEQKEETPEEKPQEAKPEMVDPDYAQKKTNDLWDQLEEYEKRYLTKKAEGYNMPDLAGTITEAKSEIKKLQLESDGLTENAFNKRVTIVTNSLEEINIKMELAAPKKFGEKMKDNLGTIATTIGVLVSSLTAYGLMKTHVGPKKD